MRLGLRPADRTACTAGTDERHTPSGECVDSGRRVALPLLGQIPTRLGYDPLEDRGMFPMLIRPLDEPREHEGRHGRILACNRRRAKCRLLQMKPHMRELLHVREAADELGVTTTTVRRHIQDGELRALRLGPNGRYRIRRGDLEEFLTEPRP